MLAPPATQEEPHWFNVVDVVSNYNRKIKVVTQGLIRVLVEQLQPKLRPVRDR